MFMLISIDYGMFWPKYVVMNERARITRPLAPTRTPIDFKRGGGYFDGVGSEFGNVVRWAIHVSTPLVNPIEPAIGWYY